MISINHENAIDYFKRDLEGLVNFFGRVFGVESPDSELDFNTFLSNNLPENRIDLETKASGFYNREEKPEWGDCFVPISMVSND
jgi:hypothetical protein